MSLRDELRALQAGDVSDDTAMLATASRDTSLFEVRPECVISPRNEADLEKLVAWAQSKNGGVTLTARSGGTGMDGGALTEMLVVDFTQHFNRVKAFSESTGIVEPGAYYRDFERESLKRNLLMPSYPASREICTVGGMVANNAGGELTLTYGKTADYVRSLRVVLADGKTHVIKPLSLSELNDRMLKATFEGGFYREMYTLIKDSRAVIEKHKPKVSKNSAGYAIWDVLDEERGVFDLTRLFTGSQGTLGLITEITFSLVSPAKHSQMMVVFLDSLEHLGDIVKTVLSFKPTTFESYDDKTMRLALRFFPGLVGRLGWRKVLSILFHSVNEAVFIALHGVPKLVLQVTFDGDNPHLLLAKEKKLKEALKQFHPGYRDIVRSSDEAKEYWLIRRESFNLLRTKVKGMKTAPFIDDIVVPTDVLSEFLPRLNAILDEYKGYMIHNIAGHIGNGNFHIIPLMDLSDEKVRAVIPEIARRVYDLVFEYGGSATGEHNDGLIRTPFLKQQFGPEMYALFRRVKDIFDPKGIFNPGKKVPADSSGRAAGSMEYALAHIAKT
jgi:FAD/FMN-containing dehydrogenase